MAAKQRSYVARFPRKHSNQPVPNTVTYERIVHGDHPQLRLDVLCLVHRNRRHLDCARPRRRRHRIVSLERCTTHHASSITRAHRVARVVSLAPLTRSRLRRLRVARRRRIPPCGATLALSPRSSLRARHDPRQSTRASIASTRSRRHRRAVRASAASAIGRAPIAIRFARPTSRRVARARCAVDAPCRSASTTAASARAAAVVIARARSRVARRRVTRASASRASAPQSIAARARRDDAARRAGRAARRVILYRPPGRRERA